MPSCTLIIHAFVRLFIEIVRKSSCAQWLLFLSRPLLTRSCLCLCMGDNGTYYVAMWMPRSRTGKELPQSAAVASIWFEIWGPEFENWGSNWRSRGSKKFNRWRHIAHAWGYHPRTFYLVVAYTQVILFMKSHHFEKCSHLIFLYIIGYNISWRPHDPTIPTPKSGGCDPQDWRPWSKLFG